jgi:ribosomal protein S18 acetylase RimI-like enzyme
VIRLEVAAMTIPIALTPPFRAARLDDAALLADCVNHAGEGMPLHLWTRLAGDEQGGWGLGRERARRDSGAFSYRNAVVIEHDGAAAGCLIGYETPDAPEPIAKDMPAMFHPLQELENLAPGTWYVNVLAVLPDHRNLGLGARLLALAEDIARALGKRGMSLIVSDGNPDAARLYRRTGYAEVARRPIVKDGWAHDGEAWLLMTKPL